MTRAHSALFLLALLAVPAASIKGGLRSGLGSTAQAKLQTLEESWGRELDGQSKKSPLERVIGLLQKMKAELIAEADKEAEMYDKMVCWCETNEKEKKKAIADAEALDKELVAEIEERAAKFGEMATTIEALKRQISEDTESLKKATAIREKEAAEFSDTEKDLFQSITNVKNAIEVLSKHHAAASSFVQLPPEISSSMKAVMKDLALKVQMLEARNAEASSSPTGASFLSTGSTASSPAAALLALVDSNSGSYSMPLEFAEKMLARNAKAAPALLQEGVAPTSGSYSPQSGQIFGILKQMKETFESNLSQEQKDEMKAVEDFKAMSASKTEQITTGKEKLDATEEASADNQKALSDAKETLEMTREQRSKDVEFLQNLQDTCMDLDKQWAARSKTRSAETLAVSEALKIITADDSMDLLRDTVTLLQVDSEAEMQVRRGRAVALLRKAARSPNFETDDLLAAWHQGIGKKGAPMLGAAGGPHAQLSTLAVSVSLDSFTKIKAAMDKMTADLKKQQEDEVKFKSYCVAELDTNEKETYEQTEQKEDLEALIEKLTKLIAKLSDEIATAKATIAETEIAIKKASQVREAENADFQTTVADQRATQEILDKALLKLTTFYKKAAFAQRNAQTPPVKFNAYKTNAGASPVIGMIEQIIEDSKALEKEAVDGETAAQAAYEKFVAESNTSIKELTDLVAAKTKATATAKEDLEQGKSDLGSTIEMLESLALAAEDLHGECDWVMKNFAARQKARLDEMEAIAQAKAILSGME